MKDSDLILDGIVKPCNLPHYVACLFSSQKLLRCYLFRWKEI